MNTATAWHNSTCARQTALERQELSCTYLAHHDLESVLMTMIIIMAQQYLHKLVAVSFCTTTSSVDDALPASGNHPIESGAMMQSLEGALTLIGKPGFLNVVIGGIEVRGDVLCVYICHCHLQMLKSLRHLQILWVVVNADDPAVRAMPWQKLEYTSFSHMQWVGHMQRVTRRA